MRDILILATIYISVPIIFLRPWTGILVWYWVALMNPHRLAWSSTVNFYSVSALVGAAALGAFVLAKDKKNISWDREMFLMLALAIWFTITTFFAWVPNEAWLHWDQMMKTLLFAFLTTSLIHGRERIRALVWVATLSIAFFGVKGGIFSIMTGGVHRIWGPAGTFIGDNNHMGLAFVITIPLIIFALKEEPKLWVRRALWVVAMLCVLSAIFTYSRGAFLGLSFVLLFAIWRTKRRWLYLSTLVPIALVAVLVLAPTKLLERWATLQTAVEEDGSAKQRLQSWSVSWNIAKRHPFGAGFRMYRMPAQRWLSYDRSGLSSLGRGFNQPRAQHSVYFQVMSEHGLIGFGLFAALMAGVFFRLGSLRRTAARLGDEVRWIHSYATGLQICLGGYIVCGAFLNLAYFPLFYLYVALTSVMRRELVAYQSKRAAVTQAPEMGVRPAWAPSGR
ncbi:MAG: putative O-glycosylation ligase, exosortase A system-associated [Candidatus Competibacterales bacterium]